MPMYQIFSAMQLDYYECTIAINTSESSFYNKMRKEEINVFQYNLSEQSHQW
jgi:hypothetical protein